MKNPVNSAIEAQKALLEQIYQQQRMGQLGQGYLGQADFLFWLLGIKEKYGEQPSTVPNRLARALNEGKE